MLLRKTGLRKAYRKVAGFLPPVNHFFVITQAAGGVCVSAPVYLLYLILHSLNAAISIFIARMRTVMRRERMNYLPGKLILDSWDK